MSTVIVLEVRKPRKASTLADAKAQITDSDGNTITIDDFRVLRNHQGELWVASPTYSVPEGKSYRYEKTVEFSRDLKRQVEDAILAAFEAQQNGGTL